MASPLQFRLAKNVLTTVAAPIPAAYSWGSRYVASPSRPLLDMAQGSPSGPPPAVVLDVMKEAVSNPTSSRYDTAEGNRQLAKALVGEMKTVYGEGIDVNDADVAITAGCNLAYASVVKTLADAGDEIILPIPWYFNHQMTNNLLGIKTVPLPTEPENGFMPSVERCASLITPKTRAIALVTPNNPTGCIYTPSLILSFAQLAKKHKIALILDETYRDFIASGPPHMLFHRPSTKQIPADWYWRSTLIHLFSFSKSYFIPGYRLGAIVGSPDLLRETTKVLDCLQICAPTAAQRALGTPDLLSSLRPFLLTTAENLAHRHALFKAHLPNTWHIGSQGGYYAFVRHPFAEKTAEEVCKRLAEEGGIVSLPVQFFTEEEAMRGETDQEWRRWIRFSVANGDDEKVLMVCRRLKECEESFAWDIDTHRS
ncbi:PLP-dependent transferase [Punctularia strigosozonata HHB-11173 SS5]|uniref:PLP-dependent transferase n=1 Tax=Punctularia strigosozonata (strain HHB-11173) TaxID=741275 RepID=UPI0004416FE6|nr:PLP-dependent transferase [Punctularia strigosozonata HHB-11173 SS5]EIN09930.1 PLP-dependent transferase [Punctularia strigosozonata HHB-11173 SS5]